jgi:hypothetical protein
VSIATFWNCNTRPLHWSAVKRPMPEQTRRAQTRRSQASMPGTPNNSIFAYLIFHRKSAKGGRRPIDSEKRRTGDDRYFALRSVPRPQQRLCGSGSARFRRVATDRITRVVGGIDQNSAILVVEPSCANPATPHVPRTSAVSAGTSSGNRFFSFPNNNIAFTVIFEFLAGGFVLMCARPLG